jgi:hypothetical protein
MAPRALAQARLARAPAARSRLQLMAASASQAALAGNEPEGQVRERAVIAPMRRSPRRSAATTSSATAPAPPDPGVSYQPNTVLIGGGAKLMRSVSGDGLT